MESAVVFDATDRGRVVATGTEAATFLHRLLANDVRGLAVGAAQRNLLLSSKGKVLFEVELLRDEERLALALPANKAKALLAALDMYLFAEKVAGILGMFFLFALQPRLELRQRHAEALRG